MADVESNINVNIDTSNALAAIKQLQAEISAFHTSMAKGGAQSAAEAGKLQQQLVNSLNATGNFAASITKVKSTTEAFTTSLEKNKFSLGEYFRYAGAATKTFGNLFQSEMATIDKVARERVKDLQTQYIKLGRDASGAIKAISVRPLTLDLEDLGTKTAIAAQKQQLFNQLMHQGSTNLLNFGKNTQWAGRQLMVGFSIPLGIAGAAAAREFMKLEEQAIRFKRVYGDTFTPSGETDKMVQQVKDLADAYTTYGIAVEKTMGLAADAAAMGKTGADLLAQIDQASRLAVLGGVDQQKALETTTSLTNAFAVATKDLAKEINFLNAVENQTVTSIDDLTTAIPTAAPVIQQLGGNVQDLAFFLTAMREGGINASEGANALKSGLASMINPTTAATEMLGKFGINLQGIVDGNKGNVKQMILDLGTALDRLDPTNRAQAIEQLFGKFQFARMSTLFQNVIKEGSQAGRVLDLTRRSASELAILSEREMKKVSDSPMYKFQAALEKFQAALAPVGEAFLKLITPIIEWGKKLLDNFNGWSDGAKNFTMILVGAVAGLGPILLMGFGLISNGAANVMKALMGLFNFFKRLGGQSKVLGEQTKYMSQEQINAMAAAASLEQAHINLTQAFTSEAAAIGKLITAYEEATVAQGRFGSVPVRTGPRATPVKKATGGMITGPGTGTSDSIPAMLSNGEAVIPAKQVAANRGLVESLISGNIPGYAKGGMIGNVPGYAQGGIIPEFKDALRFLFDKERSPWTKQNQFSRFSNPIDFFTSPMQQADRMRIASTNSAMELPLFEEIHRLRSSGMTKEEIIKTVSQDLRFKGLLGKNGAITGQMLGSTFDPKTGRPTGVTGTVGFARLKPETQLKELEKMRAGQNMFSTTGAKALTNSPLMAPYRGIGSIVSMFSGFGSRLTTSTGLQKVLDSLRISKPTQAMIYSKLAVHRSDNAELDKNLMHPKDVPVDNGRLFGPGTYFAENPVESNTTFKSFGSNKYKMNLTQSNKDYIKKSKGYLTEEELLQYFIDNSNSIRSGSKGAITPRRNVGGGTIALNGIDWNDEIIQDLIGKGYLGYKHGDALTNWMVGTPGWGLKKMATGGIVSVPKYALGGIAGMLGRSRLSTRMSAETLIEMLLNGDTRYRSGLETGTGLDLTQNPLEHRKRRPEINERNRRVRELLEEKAFGIPASAGPQGRPTYASVATMSPIARIFNRIFGGKVAGKQFNELTNPLDKNLSKYGDTSLIGKRSLSKRATTYFGDTFGLALRQLENPAFNLFGKGGKFGPVPMRGSSEADLAGHGNFAGLSKPFGRTLVPQSGGTIRSEENRRPDNIEGQILGGFTLKDIQTIITNNPEMIPGIKEALRQQGLNTKVRGPRTGLFQKLFGYATGGFIKGPGTGTSDSIPALLSNGEAVIPAKQAKRYGSLINGMISGNLPGFANGRGRRETHQAHLQGALDPNDPEVRAQILELYPDWDSMDPEVKAKTSFQGSLTAETSNSLNQKLKSKNGAPVDIFSKAWNAIDGKLLATAVAGGLDPNDPEAVKALQQIEDQIGKKATELAKKAGTGVTDAILASATNEILNETKQAGGKSAKVVQNLENRRKVVGDVRGKFTKAEYEDLLKRGKLEMRGQQIVDPTTGIVVGDERRSQSGNNPTGYKQKAQSISRFNGYTSQPSMAIIKNREEGLFVTTQAEQVGEQVVDNVEKAVVRGAKKRGKVSSPSAEAEYVGEMHSEGFLEGAKTGAKNAKPVGEAIASRNRNTNPAFGAVAAPVVAAQKVNPNIMKFFEQKTMPKVIAASQMQSAKLQVDMFQQRMNMMSTSIKNARSPITLLTDALSATKANLVSASKSVQTFGTTAANSVKQFTINAINKTKDLGEKAKEGIANAPVALGNFWNGNGPIEEEDEYGNKTKKYGGMRGKIIEKGTQFGGKIAGAGMGLSMATMMASSMGGPVGEIAGQLSGPIMAISSIASIFQMFPGILAAMTGPVGLVVAGLAAVGIGLYMMYDHLVKTRDAAKQAAEATAVSTANTQKMSEAAGTVSPSEIMQKQRDTMFENRQAAEPTWGQSQMETDFGKNMKTQLEASIKGVGEGETAKRFGTQLATNVATGVMTQAQAIDLASALGESMGNKGLGIEIIGNISKLIKDGKDITENPVDLAVKLTAQTSDSIGKSLGTIQNTGMAMWGSKEWDNMVAAEQDAAVGFSSLVTQSQQLVDNLDLEHQRRIENLTAAGDMAGIQAENDKYDKNRKALIENNTASIEKQLEAYRQLPKANQAAIAQASREGIKTQFKGTEQEATANAVADTLGATKTTYGKRGGSSTKQILTDEQQLIISTNIQAGNIDVDTFKKLQDFMKPAEGGNGAIYTAIANVSATLGGPAAGQLTDILSNFGPGQEAAAIVISAKIETAGAEEAQDLLNTYSLLQKNSGQAGTDLIAKSGEKDKSGKATAAAKKAQAQIDKATKAYKAIDALSAKGPITMEIVAQTEGFEDAKFDTGWFNGLPDEAKKFALQYFVSVSASVTDSELKGWMEKNGKSSKYYIGGGNYDMTRAKADYASEQTQTMVDTLTSSGAFEDVSSSSTSPSDGGGGGSEPPPRTITDVIADQQKRITEINNQTTAVRKLVAAGLSLADAYAIASNAEDAALIANGANADQIAELTAKTREAEKATKDLAAATNAASAALDIKERNDLAAKLAADKTLTDIQKRFILENADAARLYMNPTFDPDALKQALLDAQNASTYEFNINKLTIPGLQDIWKKGMDNAIQAFSAQENVIKINFEMKKKPFEDIIKAAQRAIQDIQNKPGGLDDLEADLERISNKEFKINKAYDDKVKALEKVTQVNDRIIAQQKSQIGLAEALTQGDIAAAAKAAQDIRSQDATSAVADQKNLLDQARKSELEGVTGTSGLTREQIEEKVRELKAQILEIEEKTLEPAQRRIELFERQQQDQIESLTVLGKTKEQWDKINASLELANTKTKEFKDAMKDALSVLTTLNTALATGTVPVVPGASSAPGGSSTTPSAPSRAPYTYPGEATWGSGSDIVKKLQAALNAGGAGLEVDGQFGPLTAAALRSFQSSRGLVADADAGPLTWRALYDAGYYAKGGMVSYMSIGGIAKMLAKGTDTIPAMLSEGEFVMQKSAVDRYGAGNLANINNGGKGSEAKVINNSSDPVYNYNINVTAGAGSSANDIAQTVVKQIRDIDYQRVKGNRF